MGGREMVLSLFWGDFSLSYLDDMHMITGW